MSAWGQLDQLLTCAICLDRYKNPKLLPCQHTFCMEPCMEGLVDYGRRQIKCPECRAEHRIPYQGVQTLPTNVTLIRFLDLHRNITGEEEEPPPTAMERCGVCSEKSYVERCSHCDKKICTDCREAHLDIMRREINRINNQVRRGLNRLTDTLTQTQKNGEKLGVNFVQVKDEIEELVRRYIKDLKDTEQKLLHELEVFVETETKSIDKLKDDLDVEVTNMNSNCELVDKYIVDDMEWTDSELVEYKDIFLKMLDFLRNFDADPSDFSRRIKFQHNSDPEVLHKTLISFGELKMNTPPVPTPAPSSTMAPPSPSSYLTPPSNALMRSQSDHRLASQFQRRQEGSSTTSGSGRFGGHTSDSERDSSSMFSRGRKDSDTSSPYRRYGERAGLRDYDTSDRESTTTRPSSRFLRPSDCDYSSSRFRDSSESDLGSRFQSRFARELLEDSGHESESHGHSRSVRFEEPNQANQPAAKERVLDTEDMTRGPLSGVIRLLDSAYVLERLHQNEIKQKQEQIEKERKANEPPPPPTPAPPPPVSRRAPSRQVSEDEIEKQKKQNQVAAAATAATPVAPSSPPPPATPPQSPLPTVPETTPSSTKPVPKRLASLKDDEPSGLRNVRGDSRSQDSAESGGSSRGSPFEDAPTSPAEPTPPARTYGWRRSSTDADAQRPSPTESKRPDSPRQSTVVTPPRQQTRSPRPPMGKSVSLDVEAGRDERRSLGGRTSSVDKKEDPRTTTKSSAAQSSYGSRLQSPRRIAEADKDEGSDSESESEVSSSESESDEPSTTPLNSSKKTEGPTTSSAVNSLLARSAQARKEMPESKNDYSRKETPDPKNDYSRTTRHSNYAREKEKEKEDSPKSTRSGVANRRESLTTKKEEPVSSRYGVTSSSRRRTSTVDDDADSRSSYIPRSRSSALISGLGSSRDVSPDESRTSGDRRAGESRSLSALRRNRIARSRSSHDMAVNDDSPEEERSTSSPYRSRFERPSDSSTTSALARSRSHHALKSREQSPEESASNSTWAQYLRTKYGSRNAAGSGGTSRSPVSRSKSSGSLYSRSGSDNTSDDEAGGHDGRRDSVFSRYGDSQNQYSFSFPRSMYMQKRKMVLRIGCRGTEPGCFTWPRGVAVGMDNSIVVADSSNHRVQVFDSNGKFLQEFGSYGSEEGKFDCLAGVAVNRIGQYIVSDRYNHRIQVFDPSGRFLRAFGCEGRTDGRFSYPWGITTDSLGFIYICDKENHRIQVFQSDGTFVGKFGSIGSRSGYLEHPHYIAVSNTNRVIVSDSNNHRIQIFDVNGRSLSTFGTEGSDEGQFKFPRGVAVDDQGYIIVGDSGNNRIQIFHPDGTFLRSFGTWGAADGEFKGLEGIAVTSTGSILVCDRENHRIQVF